MNIYPIKECDKDLLSLVSKKYWQKPAVFTNTFLSDKHIIAFVAMLEDKVVGFVFGHVLSMFTIPAKAMIYSIDVDKEHRQKGIGKALILAFLEEARLRGIQDVFVMTNTSNVAAVNLYISTNAFSSQEDACLLEWDLS